MVTIEVWSDFNCPFCYIGKRHLEDSLKSFSNQFRVEWKSFELDPYSAPEKDVSQVDLLAKKYGKDRTWAMQMNRDLTDMAISAGLDFKMDQVVPANSFNAHRLLHLAKSLGSQNELKEALLKARFTQGLDIGDLKVLTNIGVLLGLPLSDIEDVFGSERYTAEVRDDERLASDLGIRGVPFFIIDKKYTLSGARPVEVFVQTLMKVKN